MKKLIIAGGTGFLGEALTRHFLDKMDKIVILTRRKSKKNGKVSFINWDAKTPGAWCAELESATVVINLCGKSVDCRYTEKNKAIIFSSRLDSTGVIGESILKCSNPPELWINGASATIYKHSMDKPMTENNGDIGSGFSVEVCKAWEKTFNQFELPHTRKVNMRISMVLGKTGGVLPTLLKLVKNGLGGTMGSGRQLMSWICIEDFCRITDWIITNREAKGVYNIVAPEHISNHDLMKLLRRKMRMPVGLPAPSWLLEIGAFIIRTETELILKSRYAYPERLLKEGFSFKHPKISECLSGLIN
jgi:hypothetical protein